MACRPGIGTRTGRCFGSINRSKTFGQSASVLQGNATKTFGATPPGRGISPTVQSVSFQGAVGRGKTILTSARQRNNAGQKPCCV